MKRVHRHTRVVFFSLGTLSILVQITLIRQLLAAFSGNELDIALTLAAWLLSFGLGSIAGRSIPGGTLLFAFSLLGTALLLQPTIMGLKSVRLLLDITPGEIPSLSGTILVTLVCVVPVAWMTGIQFPAAVRFAEGRSYASGRVYTFEALGAAAGGLLFAFVLAGRVDAIVLSAGIATAYIILATAVTRRPALILLAAIPLLVHGLGADTSRALPWRGFEVLEEVESRFGEVVLIASDGQYTVFESGRPRFSHPDAQTEEYTVHTAVTLHPGPKRVLVIGGAPGLAGEFMKYPGLRADFVEENPVLWEILGSVPAAASDRGMASPASPGPVPPVHGDGRRFLTAAGGRTWDLVLLGVPPPTTAETNRYFTVEFFGLVRTRLAEGGILVLRGVPSFGYTGPAARELNSTLFHSLRAVFRHVAAGSRESALLIASDAPITTSPELLEERFLARHVDTKTFTATRFREIFSPREREDHLRELGRTGERNTDMRPVAYRLALAHWADLQKSRLLRVALGIPGSWLTAAIGLLAIAGAIGVRGREGPSVDFAVISTGVASMALSVTIMLSFQAVHGYVYEAVALISAAFMAGTAGGSVLAGPRSPLPLRDNPRRLLVVADGVFIALLLCVPFFLGPSPTFYLASFSGGLLTGVQFGAANRIISAGGSSPESAGRIYGLDLGGSCLGALVPALLLIPRMGVPGTLATLSLLKIASFVALLRAAREN